MLKINTILIFYFLLIPTSFAGINGCYNENGKVYFTDKPCKTGDVKKQYNERTGHELKASRKVDADVKSLTSIESEKTLTPQRGTMSEASEKKENDAIFQVFQESKHLLDQYRAEAIIKKEEIAANPDTNADEKAKLIAATNATFKKQKDEIATKAKTAYEARVKTLQEQLKKETDLYRQKKQKVADIIAARVADDNDAQARLDKLTRWLDKQKWGY